MKTAMIILWVLWGILLLAWPSNLLIALLQREPGEAPEPDLELISTLGYVGFFSLSLTFVLRWFLLRFLINQRRIPLTSPWSTAILVIGSLMIWALTKSVEIYGLIIFLSSKSLPHYLGFWIPSILIMLIHMPFLLDPRRGRNQKAEPVEGGKASPATS